MSSRPLTTLLKDAAGGDREASEKLYRAVYDPLRRLARAQLRRGGSGTLETTELVHEAYLKLFATDDLEVRDRSHFFALSSRVMRQVLVSHFRRSSAARRGGPEEAVTLDEGLVAGLSSSELVLAVHEALARLETIDARLAQVVECRFFGGMTQAEIGEALGVNERTVRRDWRVAKTWLAQELGAC